MTKTGEIYNVMAQFEKLAKDSKCSIYTNRLDREEKQIGEGFANGYYYEHGETNQMFKAFLVGYSLGKVNA